MLDLTTPAEKLSIEEAASVLAAVDVASFIERLRSEEPAQAAVLLQGLMRLERFLSERNRLKAYEEKLPLVLRELEPSRIAAIFEHLDAATLHQALFGNFRVIEHSTKMRIFEAMSPHKVAELLEEMAFGVDAPKAAAKVLSDMSREQAARVTEMMDEEALKRIEEERGLRGAYGEMGELIGAYGETGELMGAYGETRELVRALERADAPLAAAQLTSLARRNPELAAETLRRLRKKVWVREADGKKREEVYSCRAAAIIEALDLRDKAAVALLKAIPPGELKEVLKRVGEEKRRAIASLLGLGEVGFAPPCYPPCKVRGRRRSKVLPYGMRWIRIEEVFETELGPRPMLIDLLEMDPADVRLKACRAVTDERLIPIAEAEELFGDVRRRDKMPRQELFRRLGLIRLREEVERTGAIAGINGNFYFDYGNYIDARKLGLDLKSVPGLYFGDLVGWFVTDGVELSPPIFNRAALIVTEDGRIHIRKVVITHMVIGGKRVTWEAVNQPRGGGKTVLYNSLWGFETEPDADYVDVSIIKGRIHEIREGGGVRIPLLGFVLSIPREKAKSLLAGVQAGDKIELGNNFPAHLGKVKEAMACGPQLVRDGQVDLDFEFEDFGEKDSSVVPFSLTRAVDTFRTARSFVMLANGKLILGAVSGTYFGSGEPRVSLGMTFGELAQLALDLGAEQAIALDGGGSSSLVARTEEGVKVLNVPTGGADVPEGEERFINTHWLVFEG